MNGGERLVEKWRRWAERHQPPHDAWSEGYNAALQTCADGLERHVDAASSPPDCRLCGTSIDSDIGRDIGLCPSCDSEASP